MGDGVANGTLVDTGTGHTINRTIQIGVNSTTPAVTDTGGAPNTVSLRISNRR